MARNRYPSGSFRRRAPQPIMRPRQQAERGLRIDPHPRSKTGGFALNKYTRIPTLTVWQADSSVPLTVRRADPVLHRIDILVQAFNEGALYLMRGVACDLYYSVDYWLQHVKTNPGMDRRRLPAMNALYAVVVDFLCGAFNCGVNTLPRELDLMFGRELTELGFRTDFEHGRAEYLSRKALDHCKVWFKGGLAYQWADASDQRGRKLVNSADMQNTQAAVVKEGQLPNPGASPFVLSMSRNLYMAAHKTGEVKAFDGFYHSSYLAGETVMAAGTMVVENGRIRRMRSDSGHYKPFDTNMLQVLQTLKMLAVPIHDIIVENFVGRHAVKAPVFWNANGNWNHLRQRRDENLAERRDLYIYKEDRRNPKRASAAEAVDYGEGTYEDRE